MKTGKLITGLVVLVFSLVIVAVSLNSASAGENMVSASSYRAVEHDFGSGGYAPQVIGVGDAFVVAYLNYNAKMLNVSLVNATDGHIVENFTMAHDVNKYFRIVIDEVNACLLVTWLNNSGYINGTFINDTIRTNNFTIADHVGTTGYGLAYGDGKIFAVWSNDSYGNLGRFITFNTNDPNSPILSSVFEISTDTHSHAKNFVAYDDVAKTFLVVWKNNTASGTYGVTAKLFDTNGNNITGDIMITDGLTSYFYPSAEGGPGEFLIAYSNPSTYEVNGTYIDATTGAIIKNISIGTTYQYGTSSTVGMVYNGTYFVVTWANSSEDIVAQMFDENGNAVFSSPQKISSLDDENQWADVGYANDTNSYYFVWYDYTSKHNYGSLWTSDEFVPEFNFVLPVLAVALVGIILVRRKH